MSQLIGRSIKRKEDPKFLTGTATYIDDIRIPRLAHAVFLRSPYPHAKIKQIDVKDALSYPGVIAIVTGKDLHRIPVTKHGGARERYILAKEKVRFVGEAVAGVAAETKAQAEDAIDAIRVDYEPLNPVVEAEVAQRPDSPLLYEEKGSNVAWEAHLEYGNVKEAFGNADLVLEEEMGLHRYSSTPLETFGCIAQFDAFTQSLKLWTNHASPPRLLEYLSGILDIEVTASRIIVPEIGGSFGNRLSGGPYCALTALLSYVSRRPVKWIADRKEDLLAQCHSPTSSFNVRAAVDKQGKLLGLSIKDVEDVGSRCESPFLYVLGKLANAVGPYGVRNFELDGRIVVTNKCPAGANRGVAKPGMALILERLMDRIARRLELDPAEVRFRNFIAKEEFPYRTPTGNLYDSGNYNELLRRALTVFEYDKMRALQRKYWKEGRYFGIGISTSVEPSGSNASYKYLFQKDVQSSGSIEAATVKVEPSSRVTVILGGLSSGQGHETTASQIVADQLGVKFEMVDVVSGFDSAIHPYTGDSGTLSNKYTVVDTGAIVQACKSVQDKILRIAAHTLREKTSDLYIVDGVIRTKNTDEKMSVADIAELVYSNPLCMPLGEDPGLQTTSFYSVPYADLPDSERRVKRAFTFASAAHVALVEVDVETGSVSIGKYLIVHECGKVINPMIVEGQLHGATIHGIAASLFEEYIYDSEGQLLTSTFMDYLKPTAAEAPSIQIQHLESSSPFTPLGAKGMGEAGTLLAPATIANAAEDALSPFGVSLRGLPLTPERVLLLLEKSRQGVNPANAKKRSLRA